MTGWDRRILPGLLPNLRDCGGLRTTDGGTLRRGFLLRSAALVALPDAAVADLAETVGMATYVDLRTDREVARDGSPAPLTDAGWRWHRHPLDDKTADDDSDLPADVLRRCQRALPDYARAAREVAALLGPRPVVVGCAAGKDRTGTVIALLLHWLGVRRDDILADYTLSNDCLSAARRLLPPRWRDPRQTIGPVDGAVCAAVLDQAREVYPAPAGLARMRPSLVTREPGAPPGAFGAVPALRR